MPSPRKVTASSFGQVKSVTATGKENIPSNVNILRGDEVADRYAYARRFADAASASAPRWIDVLGEGEDHREIKARREAAYQASGIWTV